MSGASGPHPRPLAQGGVQWPFELALEPETDRELDDSRIAGARDLPERGTAERSIGIAVVHRVEEIERLRAEIRGVATKCEPLHEAQVRRPGTRAPRAGRARCHLYYTFNDDAVIVRPSAAVSGPPATAFLTLAEMASNGR